MIIPPKCGTSPIKPFFASPKTKYPNVKQSPPTKLTPKNNRHTQQNVDLSESPLSSTTDVQQEMDLQEEMNAKPVESFLQKKAAEIKQQK